MESKAQSGDDTPAAAAIYGQAQFHARWGALRDPHVRALAWLIDAPDLLDDADARWGDRIARLPEDAGRRAAPWLFALDADPAGLHELIDAQPTARLGRYAEKLMAFYLAREGDLVAHGLQVRDENGDGKRTVGEFDFLLRVEDDAGGEGLLHWEFATKFYLRERPAGAQAEPDQADYFIGPNLADTLGRKMHKIFDRQLALGRHPAAQRQLTLPVVRAQALVKGWLFYHRDDLVHEAPGVSARHCRGFWCEELAFFAQLAADGDDRWYAILPRLCWLAPARIGIDNARRSASAQTPVVRDAAHQSGQPTLLDAAQLRQALVAHFETDSMPVMVAMMMPEGEGEKGAANHDGIAAQSGAPDGRRGGPERHAVETARGFVVPANWRSLAGLRRGRSGPGMPEEVDASRS